MRIWPISNYCKWSSNIIYFCLILICGLLEIPCELTPFFVVVDLVDLFLENKTHILTHIL